MDGRTAGPSPRAPPRRTPHRPNRAHRRTRRSREQDCFRRPSLRGSPATATPARGPPLQRSPSSMPPPNQQRNHSSGGVFTQPGSKLAHPGGQHGRQIDPRKPTKLLHRAICSGSLSTPLRTWPSRRRTGCIYSTPSSVVWSCVTSFLRVSGASLGDCFLTNRAA